MKKLKIVESKWLRGGYRGALITDRREFCDEFCDDSEPPDGKTYDSALYDRTSKKMCCLGFAARKAGCSIPEIDGIELPEALPASTAAKVAKLFPWMLTEHSDIHELTSTNDDPDMPLRERKSKIKEVFAKHGWEVEFV